MYSIQRIAGPAVRSGAGGYRCACRLSHNGGHLCCDSLKSTPEGGSVCDYWAVTRAHDGQPQPVPDPADTPDFCPMKAGMLADAVEMDALHKRGLARMTGADLRREARGLPDAYAIRGASRMPVEKLRREVLRALEREDADRENRCADPS